MKVFRNTFDLFNLLSWLFSARVNIFYSGFKALTGFHCKNISKSCVAAYHFTSATSNGGSSRSDFRKIPSRVRKCFQVKWRNRTDRPSDGKKLPNDLRKSVRRCRVNCAAPQRMFATDFQRMFHHSWTAKGPLFHVRRKQLRIIRSDQNQVSLGSTSAVI